MPNVVAIKIEPARIVCVHCNSVEVRATVERIAATNKQTIMKKSLIALALLSALTLVARADDDDKKPAPEKKQATAEQKALRKQMTEKYDTNKDGKLDAEERAKMSEEDKAKLKAARSKNAEAAKKEKSEAK